MEQTFVAVRIAFVLGLIEPPTKLAAGCQRQSVQTPGNLTLNPDCLCHLSLESAKCRMSGWLKGGKTRAEQSISIAHPATDIGVPAASANGYTP
jgi:hypothetical protein